MSRGCFINAWGNKMLVSPFIFLNRSHGWHLTHHVPSPDHFILISEGSRENAYLVCLSSRVTPLGSWGEVAVRSLLSCVNRALDQWNWDGRECVHNEPAMWHTLLSFGLLGTRFSCVSSPLLSQWSEVANVLFLPCILLYFWQSSIKLSHQLQLFHGAETVEILWGCILDSESSYWKSAGLMDISTPKRGFGSKLIVIPH